MLLKTPTFRLLFFYCLLVCPLKAGAAPATNSVSASAYLEVSRGPHSRVMQRTATFTNAAGTVITSTNRYTEIATVLSHLAGNQLVPSSDEFEITANGAMATNCQSPVFINANLNTAGAVDLITPDGQHMTSDIAALVYFDGVTNVVIATPHDSIGQLLPSLNEILFTNYFGGLADVLFRNSISGFSQNIVIKPEQLPSPSSLGLTGSNSVWLQVWSEFTSALSASISTNPATGDQLLSFGQMQMARGRAFMLGTNGPSVPVTKQWFSSTTPFVRVSVAFDTMHELSTSTTS